MKNKSKNNKKGIRVRIEPSEKIVDFVEFIKEVLNWEEEK